MAIVAHGAVRALRTMSTPFCSSTESGFKVSRLEIHLEGRRGGRGGRGRGRGEGEGEREGGEGWGREGGRGRVQVEGSLKIHQSLAT